LNKKLGIKLVKGLVENNNPSTFFAGNAPQPINSSDDLFGKDAGNPSSSGYAVTGSNSARCNTKNKCDIKKDLHFYFLSSAHNETCELDLPVKDAFPVMEANKDDNVPQDTVVTLPNKKGLPL
jgi:hypothetical protein